MIKYLLSANTSDGYVSFYSEAIKKLKRIYIVSSVSDGDASEIIKEVAEKKGADEMIVSPIDTDIAVGCVIGDVGIFSENIKNTPTMDENYFGLYSAYSQAKKIHDDWEKIYVGNMDINKLNIFSVDIINKLVNDSTGTGSGKNVNRFFGASTPSQPVNFIDNITAELNKRYFIKGRPGTGKSTFLKKLRDEANRRNFDTETYYCSFDPLSLDMVVIRELSLCVFDSTAPHEMFPQSERDSILDFYEGAGLIGTDKKYQAELEDITTQYNEKIQEGISYLKNISNKINRSVSSNTKKQVIDLINKLN